MMCRTINIRWMILEEIIRRCFLLVLLLLVNIFARFIILFFYKTRPTVSLLLWLIQLTIRFLGICCVGIHNEYDFDLL